MITTNDSRPKVLALCGSERRNGNTDLLLEYAAKGFAQRSIEMTTIHLCDEEISGPCGPCGDCNTRTQPCAVSDGVASVVQRMRNADGILYGLPVHGFGTAGIMQQFIERAGVGFLRFDRPLANKVAGVIVTGRRFGLEQVYTQIVNNILLNRMILAGSGFPALILGGLPGSSLQDEEGLRALDLTVARMAGLLHYFQEGRRCGVDETFLELSQINERQALIAEGKDITE